MALQLRIVSPEKVEFDGEITRVALPGTSGRFEILSDHAPFISSLAEGPVEYTTADGKKDMQIRAGFVSVKGNQVEVCVEI